VSDWYLTAAERNNPSTRLDRRHPGNRAWTDGNLVEPIVHGAAYYEQLYHAIEGMRDGDLLMFVDWRGDPDERLVGTPDSAIARVLARAVHRGVDVRGLIWRSHLDKLTFSAAENRHLGEDVNKAGGECVLDMRVIPGGSHHQKFLVLRHPDRPERDVAFLGGIDLCHSRRDDASHAGDPQPQRMAKVYGPRPPWHDVQLRITGPAVGDVETVFRERWEDPAMPSRNPLRMLEDRLRRDEPKALEPLPEQRADPAPAGRHPVQLLRTYGNRTPGYPFAPKGERSIALGYCKALGRARRLVYVEDQYLWSRPVARVFAEALRAERGLRLIVVLPHHPDQDGRLQLPCQHVGRAHALAVLRAAAPDRVAFYGVENSAGDPVYVHAKVGVVDDAWAAVGSGNVNLRSWTHDSEVTAAVADAELAAGLRRTLAREHLEQDDDEGLDLDDVFDTFARSAARLQDWYDGHRRGPRPRGRLRPVDEVPVPRSTRLWATPVYRTVYDPDGRPLRARLRRRF
jgi:phosphatidylserine/phosphatidylglycerophosphate/cardiolipin synthase-like enzyme